MAVRGEARIFALWSRQSPDCRIAYDLDDEGFQVTVGDSRSRHAWNGLRRLDRHEEVWILEIVKNAIVFFPPSAASAEAREFLVERCRTAGVKS